FASMGTAGLILAGVGIAAAAALAPLVVTLGAFAAGVAAVATVAALAVGGIGALAAGIVVLTAATQHWTGATQTVPQAQAAVANAVNAHQAAVIKLDATTKAYNASSTHTAAQTLALHQAQQAAADSAAKLTKAQ